MLKNKYGIIALPSSSKTTTLQGLFNTAVHTLEDHGLVEPSKLFRPLNSVRLDLISDKFRNYCLQDLSILTLISLSQDPENPYISLDEMSFPSGYKGYVQHLESSAYGNLLGFRRPTFSAETQEQLNHIDTKKETPNNFMSKFLVLRNDNNDTVYKQYKSTANFKINRLCDSFISALVYCRKCDPFNTQNIALKLNTNTSNTQQFLNNYFEDLLGLEKNSLPDYKDLFSEEYREAIEYILEPAVPLSQFNTEYQNEVSSQALKKFYNNLTKCIEKTSKGAMTNSLDKNDIRFRKWISFYISEYLYGFKFCENLTCSKINLEKEGVLKLMHLLSEFQFCNTRLFFLDLYNSTYDNNYVFIGKTFSFSANFWKQHLMKHMLYTWDIYIPALYYCFVYLYKRNYDLDTTLLENYLSHKNDNLNFSVERSLFKKSEAISFYKIRKQEFLTPFPVSDTYSKDNNSNEPFETFTPVPDGKEPYLDHLEAKLNAIPKNLF